MAGFWTPTILFADRSGKVRYQSPNFLPPDALLDVMDIGEALVAMRWKGYDDAIELLNEVNQRSPEGPVTPEALYWRGIAAYFRDGSSSTSAHREWQELLDRFPESIWACGFRNRPGNRNPHRQLLRNCLWGLRYH